MNLPPLLERALDRGARRLVTRARTNTPVLRPGVRRPILKVAHDHTEAGAVVAVQVLAQHAVLVGPIVPGANEQPIASFLLSLQNVNYINDLERHHCI